MAGPANSRAGSAQCAAGMPGLQNPAFIETFRNKYRSIRQRNELRFIYDTRKAAGLPIGLGLLDALLRAGDEIPPDMARPIHALPAQKQQARGDGRMEGHLFPGPEDQQPAGLDSMSPDLDGTAQHIEGALLMLRRQGQGRPGRHLGIGAKGRRESGDRRAGGAEVARDHPEAEALRLISGRAAAS